jgi:proton glutamate symport protein
MSLSSRMLIGVGAGVLVGLLVGDRAAVLAPLADAYVKLLQMTVLPYVTVALVSGIGSLGHGQVRSLGLRVGLVLLLVWAVALGSAFLFPLMFPALQTASFFSASLLAPPSQLDVVDLYIPANPFHSLANNVVPAVVVFSVVLGLALIRVRGKERLLELLGVAGAAIAGASKLVVSLTPYGLFVITAATAGTFTMEQFERLQVYVLGYVAMSLLLGLWVLPGLVAVLTDVPYREVLWRTRDALVMAFATGSVFAVLPMLIEESRGLVRDYLPNGPSAEGTPDVIIPAAYPFPHAGKVLSLSFILFAGWFADAAVPLHEYPRLAGAGLLSLFGSVDVAMPFLLDLFRIPADTYQLFLATSVVNSRFGSLVAAVHTVAVALLGTWAVSGRLRPRPGRLAVFLGTSAGLGAAVIAGGYALFTFLVPQRYDGDRLVTGMQFLSSREPATVYKDSSSVPVVSAPAGPLLEQVHRRGLRAGYFADNVPFSYFNSHGELVGFDVERAYQLAHDIGVRLELVPVERERLHDRLDGSYCDIVMSGVVVTADRAGRTLFSQSYLDETLAFVVADHLREGFATWASIREQRGLRLGVPPLPHLVEAIHRQVPGAEIVTFVSPSSMLAEAGPSVHAFVLTAERGSAWTLLHPDFTVVVPQPHPVRVPLAYPIARSDQDFATLVNTWIELKRKDGTADQLYEHWILGRQPPGQRHRRWSILKDVLGWDRP